MKFAVYEHTLIVNNKLISKYFVVLKDGKDIVAWTDFHKYIRSQKRIKRIEANNKPRFNNIVKFLKKS